jgi:NTE family protein
VTIDGRAYWDGGFSANPDLVTLARESPVGDTLIVKLHALRGEGVPMSAREISARINQITFNQPMLRDIEVIETIRAHRHRWPRMANSADARLACHRFHLIEAGRFTSALAPESKGKPDLELLTYLHGAGRSETEKWLARSRNDVGRRGTVDLARHFLAERPAPEPSIAGEPASPDAAA